MLPNPTNPKRQIGSTPDPLGWLDQLHACLNFKTSIVIIIGLQDIISSSPLL